MWQEKGEHVYVFLCVYMCVCVYVGDRERKRERGSNHVCDKMIYYQLSPAALGG